MGSEHDQFCLAGLALAVRLLCVLWDPSQPFLRWPAPSHQPQSPNGPSRARWEWQLLVDKGLPALRMVKEAILHKFVLLAIGKLTRKRATEQGLLLSAILSACLSANRSRLHGATVWECLFRCGCSPATRTWESCVSCHFVTHPQSTATSACQGAKSDLRPETAVFSIKFCFSSRALYARVLPFPFINGIGWPLLGPAETPWHGRSRHYAGSCRRTPKSNDR